MERRWMTALRERRYVSIDQAARAADVSVRLLETIEAGSVTGPELARRIGRAYGMSEQQVREITCQATVERRKTEARLTLKQRQHARLSEIYSY